MGWCLGGVCGAVWVVLGSFTVGTCTACFELALLFVLMILVVVLHLVLFGLCWS